MQLMQAYMLNSVNPIRTNEKLINKIRSNSALTHPLLGPQLLTKKPGIYTCSWAAVTEHRKYKRTARAWRRTSHWKKSHVMLTWTPLTTVMQELKTKRAAKLFSFMLHGWVGGYTSISAWFHQPQIRGWEGQLLMSCSIIELGALAGGAF